MYRPIPVLGIAALLLLACAPWQARAVEINDMKGFEDLYGRYAPKGDCKRRPQIVVDAGGMTFEVAAEKTRVTDPEFAASYFSGAGDNYDGISRVFFPFRPKPDYYPIMMAFNADEQKGVLAITGHEEGWKGGPALSPRNQALVSGSPYSRCK
ncbi:MAG: hypothetical protein ABWY94_12135 [Pseudoxanthomonas sp.]